MKKPNFPLAFLLATVAGGLAAFLASLLIIPLMGSDGEDTFAGTTIAASLIAIYATAITAVYALIIGSAVVIYVRVTRRVPSLATAIVVALGAGGLPFIATPFVEYARRAAPSKFDLYLVPALAIVASMTAAWTFWRVGLRGRG